MADRSVTLEGEMSLIIRVKVAGMNRRRNSALAYEPRLYVYEFHGEVGDKLPKSSPGFISIKPGIQRPSVEPTKAPLFARDPIVDRLPTNIVEFCLNKKTISAPALVTVPLSIADLYRYEDDIATYVNKRFNYGPETQEITFHMTTPTHDKFAKYVEDAILKELSKLDEGHSSFVAGIVYYAMASVLRLVLFPVAIH
ncbi:hypothetical protein FMUND_13516 [Fusarium mundagurra]|uniref:Uncharacterized protein n=1 Tax=Fusarium mundagurra TaxID=1567541 RepID=A0A8H5XZU4_9HYPO|nr:hypothetical protein FMUND_13516 [Fusarium mundagurra]